MSINFRNTFDFSKVPKDFYHWFPGHMAKGLKKMYEHLPNVDAVIEVHDARIPLTGRNLSFRERIIGNKPYAYVLNKADLADFSQVEEIKKRLNNEGYSPTFFTVLKDTSDKNTRNVKANFT